MRQRGFSCARRWTPGVAGRAVLVGALLLCACAAPGTRKVPLEERDALGFRISEAPRVPAGARADFARALELLEEERLAEGIALLREVTASAPEATSAHIDLGIALRRVGDLDAAAQSLARALELSPRHPVAHNELGIVLRLSGRFSEARASYERALELHPEFHFARRNLAILCDLYLADFECALHNYEALERSLPGDASVAMWLADLRNRVGDPN